MKSFDEVDDKERKWIKPTSSQRIVLTKKSMSFPTLLQHLLLPVKPVLQPTVGDAPDTISDPNFLIRLPSVLFLV